MRGSRRDASKTTRREVPGVQPDYDAEVEEPPPVEMPAYIQGLEGVEIQIAGQWYDNGVLSTSTTEGDTLTWDTTATTWDTATSTPIQDIRQAVEDMKEHGTTPDRIVMNQATYDAVSKALSDNGEQPTPAAAGRIVDTVSAREAGSAHVDRKLTAISTREIANAAGHATFKWTDHNG